MNESVSHQLIPVSTGDIGGETRQTVNGRDLHAFLGVGKDFTNWAKDQIARARLKENRDFVVYAEKGVNPSGGRPTMEYHFTIEASKHIAMMSGTDKGFEAREYFLECERVAIQSKFSAPMLPALPDTIAASALSAWMQAASVLSVPAHFAQTESVKAVKARYGVDFAPLLTHSQALDAIREDEEMLEPADLAVRFGIKSGKEMNSLLCEAGLQVHGHGGQWVPTESGRSLCSRHAWSRGTKAGYNWKWRVAAIREVLRPRLVSGESA